MLLSVNRLKVTDVSGQPTGSIRKSTLRNGTDRAEAWALTKKEKQAPQIFESKIFRRIYDPKYENEEWKSRNNRELEEMSKGENIVKWIKGQRISWLGHLERMEEDRMPQKIFTQ